MKLFNWRYMACPFVIDWSQIVTRNFMRERVASETWKAFYFFGLRLAMWRPEGG